MDHFNATHCVYNGENELISTIDMNYGLMIYKSWMSQNLCSFFGSTMQLIKSFIWVSCAGSG